MVIYVVYTQCLRYNICSAWFLDIRISPCIIHACSSASQCLRDFRSSSGSFGSPVLATSVELVQTKAEFSSLKTDVMMTANRCSDLIF